MFWCCNYLFILFFFLHLCTFSELGVAGFLTEYLLTECGFSKLQGCSNSTVTFFWFVSLHGCTVVSLWSQCQCGHQVFHLFNRKVLFNPILFNNIAIFNYCQKIFHMLAWQSPWTFKLELWWLQFLPLAVSSFRL